MTTTPAVPSLATPAAVTDENKFLNMFVEADHASFVDRVLEVNPELEDDIVRIAAVVFSQGLDLGKIFFKVFKEEQNERTTVPLGQLTLERFKMSNVAELVRVPGRYKASMHGRWKSGGTLRIYRFTLEPSHFAAVAPVAPQFSGGGGGAMFTPGSMMEKAFLDMVVSRANTPPPDPSVAARNLIALSKELMPPAPPGITIQDVKALLDANNAAEPETVSSAPTWPDKLVLLAEKFLPQIIAAIPRLSPLAAAGSIQTVEGPKVEGVPPAAAAPAPNDFDVLQRALVMGVAAKAVPDTYALLIADAMRLQGQATIDAFLATDRTMWATMISHSVPELSGELVWLQDVEDMVRGEFSEVEDENATDQKSAASAD